MATECHSWSCMQVEVPVQIIREVPVEVIKECPICKAQQQLQQQQ